MNAATDQATIAYRAAAGAQQQQHQQQQQHAPSCQPVLILPKRMLIPAADLPASPIYGSHKTGAPGGAPSGACGSNPHEKPQPAKVMVIKRIQKRSRRKTDIQQMNSNNFNGNCGGFSGAQQMGSPPASRFRNGAQKDGKGNGSLIYQPMNNNNAAAENLIKSEKKPQNQQVVVLANCAGQVGGGFDRKRSAILLDNYRTSHSSVVQQQQQAAAAMWQPRSTSLCNNGPSDSQVSNDVKIQRTELRMNPIGSFGSQSRVQQHYSPSPIGNHQHQHSSQSQKRFQPQDFKQIIDQCLVPDYKSTCNNYSNINSSKNLEAKSTSNANTNNGNKPYSQLIKLRARSTARFSLYKSVSSLQALDTAADQKCQLTSMKHGTEVGGNNSKNNKGDNNNMLRGSPKTSNSTASTSNIINNNNNQATAAVAIGNNNQFCQLRRDSGILSSVASLNSAVGCGQNNKQQQHQVRSQSGTSLSRNNPIKPCVNIRQSMKL